MCVLSFDDGMAAESWYADVAWRNRVSMSAIGSVIVMQIVPLSPRFLVRWVSGTWRGASRRSVAPLRGAGWVERLPARLAHARQLAGVRHLPQTDAAEPELAEDRVRSTAPLTAGVAADCELGLAVRLVDKSLLGHLLVFLPGSAGRRHDGLAGEGEPELAEQLATLLIGGGGGHQGDVHAARPVDPVDVDLAEHRLLGQTERVVAVAVELLGVQATEVTDAGQGQRQEPVEELPHAVATDGDLGADRHALAQLELCDGLPGPDDGGLLAGDGGQIAHRAVHQLGIAGGLADAHVNDDLRHARDLHDVAVAELLLEGRHDRLAVVREQPGQLSGGCGHVSQRS